MVENEVFIFFQKTSKAGVNYSVTREFRRGNTQHESIRITLSDLDPQQVARRATGHFQPRFPSSRSVMR
jgi:hypothetical protein